MRDPYCVVRGPNPRPLFLRSIFRIVASSLLSPARESCAVRCLNISGPWQSLRRALASRRTRRKPWDRGSVGGRITCLHVFNPSPPARALRASRACLDFWDFVPRVCRHIIRASLAYVSLLDLSSAAFSNRRPEARLRKEYAHSLDLFSVFSRRRQMSGRILETSSPGDGAPPSPRATVKVQTVTICQITCYTLNGLCIELCAC